MQQLCKLKQKKVLVAHEEHLFYASDVIFLFTYQETLESELVSDAASVLR